MVEQTTVNRLVVGSSPAFPATYKGIDMFYILLRFLRKKIDKEKMCDECFSEYKHQTKDGKMLCERCYRRYL